MKFGVVVFPGSNCDQDMIYALHANMGYEVKRLWHKHTDLQGVDAVVLPGGFSYGDYLRSGAIARFSPIMDAVQAHAKAGGFVLGVCNGFQILTEAHMLPGALLRNDHQKFSCKNVYIKPEAGSSLGNALGSDPLKIPIAHAEGRYYADASTIARLEGEGQVMFRYCDATGAQSTTSNANGSVNAIAGIRNSKGNVIGMMPHPERAADQALGNTDGKRLLQALVGIMMDATTLAI